MSFQKHVHDGFEYELELNTCMTSSPGTLSCRGNRNVLITKGWNVFQNMF